MNEEIIDKISTFLEKAAPDVRDRYFITKTLNEEYWLDIQGEDELEEDLDETEEEKEEEPENDTNNESDAEESDGKDTEEKRTGTDKKD